MRGFSDKELLDPNFPSPRLKNHRELRHKYYRDQAAREKRSKAIQLYSKGWIAILWDLWKGYKLK